MKLINLLVKELPSLGGWLDDFLYVTQDSTLDVYMHMYKPILSHDSDSGFGYYWSTEDKTCSTTVSRPSQLATYHTGVNRLSQLATDHATAIITRKEYEAALAAYMEAV